VRREGERAVRGLWRVRRALSPASAQQVHENNGPEGYDPRVQKYILTELDSGDRVISERVESVRSVAIGFWIGAGSRDERPDRAGVSHFIEHMLFKGSSRHSAQQIAESFDEMGSELNAATSREHTVVYTRVPDERIETALDVMTDMVFAPSFADLDSEREVVLEEIAMYEDTPQELVHDLFSEAVFGDHPLGRPVIGTAEVISSISRRAVAAHHRAAYAGGNIVVAAAGNLEHDRFVGLLERAREHAAASQRHIKPRAPLVKTPPPGLRFGRKDTEQYNLCLGAPGIARSDRRRFAASLLDSILGGSASSRLFQEIREKRGMAYSVYSFASQYTDTGVVGVYVGTREDNLAACAEICAAEIADLAAGNLRPRELERAKENLKGRLMLGMESTSSRMSRLGKSLITDTELLSFERIMAEIDAVEGDQVCELAGVLLAPEKLSVAGIGPGEDRFRDAVRTLNPALLARPAAA
jgi:predicted Zn-dependent peptidase